jgi:hypothetical protein
MPMLQDSQPPLHRNFVSAITGNRQPYVEPAAFAPPFLAAFFLPRLSRPADDFDFFADFFAAFFGIAFLAFGTRKTRMQPGHNGLRSAKRDMTPS